MAPYVIARAEAADAEADKEKLISILKDRAFDESSIEGKATSVKYKGHTFKVDTTGKFYLEDTPGKKHTLRIYYNEKSPPGEKEFLIYDPKHPAAGLEENPLNTGSATPEQTNDFDDLVSLQRQYGIYSMKTKNPECYFAYAAQRIKTSNPFKRLLALEREENPRPLAFGNDREWEEFKRDLKAVFKPLEGPNSYIVILGTSTTFFSENPRKGRNSALFEEVPACVERSEDPKKSLMVYTFDTPGQDRSDLDVHLLIPTLSNLCHKAEAKARNALGNTGERIVYYENTLDKCFLQSVRPELKGQVRPLKTKPSSLLSSALPDKALGKFLRKWTKKLKREINFSVLIRPDQRKEPLTEPGVKDFSQTDYLKRRIIIPLTGTN